MPTYEEIDRRDAGNLKALSSGLKIAFGATVVTGTNQEVATGLRKVMFCMVSLRSNITISYPLVSAYIQSDQLIVSVYKFTSATDCTPIAATSGANVNWIAIGE